jgi:hypothetical protein
MQRRNFLTSIGTLLLPLISSTARAVALETAPPRVVPGDRWMEIDLYWFDCNRIQNSVNEFWDRFTPLYRGVLGDR